MSITEKCGNLRKVLKKDILESISTLRKEFSQLKIQLETVNKECKKLREEIKNGTEEMAKRRDSQLVGQVATSVDHIQQSPRDGARHVLPSEGGRRKLYSDAVKIEKNQRYRITLKAKDGTLTPERIKLQLKQKINPTDIKVGIKVVKSLRDRGIIIETGSEEEINTLSSEINTKLGERMEIIKHKLRKPRPIIYNVSEEISTENIVVIIKPQNPEIITNEEEI